MQISATAFFCAGLLTLSIGYIFVELLWGEKYFFRKALKRNDNYRLDRVIHYIMRGLMINVVYFSMQYSVGNLWGVANMFNISGKMASVFSISPSLVVNIQMIIFSILHFIQLVIILLIFFGIAKIFSIKSKSKK